MEPLLIIVGVAAVFGVIVVLIIVASVQERKRTEQLRQIAEELSFRFLGENDGGLMTHLDGFNLFSQGRSRKLKNLMLGTSSDTEVSIFDYRYTVGSGKNSQTLRQTAICFQSGRLNLPNFELRPEHWYHKIGSMFGYQDIDFSDFPKFSKRYILRGDDEQGVRELFTAEVVEFFERLENVSTEGHGERLVVYRSGKRVKPHEARNFLEECFGVYSALTQSTT